MEEIGMINQRNMELIQTLRTLDSAFSMGESGELLFLNLTRFWNDEIDPVIYDIYWKFIHFLDNGRLCIRFGMVSMETDVEELLALVINTGKQLDEQVIISIYHIQDFE